jgi:uncharacterized protein (DUF4415 family)
MRGQANRPDPELEALMRLRDEDIDTSDIPEITDWSKAVVGRFYRPLKEPVTLRLDADIIAWLKSEGRGYQTRINTLLRTAMTCRTVDVGAVQSRNAQCDMGSQSNATMSDFCFPSLEKHQDLDKYGHVAELVEHRGSLFARAA